MVPATTRIIFLRLVLGGSIALVVAHGSVAADATEEGLEAPTVLSASDRSPTGDPERSPCPCTGDPFFASFLDGQRELLACTNNSFDPFVRLVASNIDLVVLFTFPPQLFCAWQPDGSGTSFMSITAREFDVCRRSILRAAALQGVACPPEL